MDAMFNNASNFDEYTSAWNNIDYNSCNTSTASTNKFYISICTIFWCELIVYYKYVRMLSSFLSASILMYVRIIISTCRSIHFQLIILLLVLVDIVVVMMINQQYLVHVLIHLLVFQDNIELLVVSHNIHFDTIQLYV